MNASHKTVLVMVVTMFGFALLSSTPTDVSGQGAGRPTSTPTPNSGRSKNSQAGSDAQRKPSVGGETRSAGRVVLRNQLGMTFVNVPAGNYLMGSAKGYSDQRPVHRVTIRVGFLMGQYEVTQGQWRTVMGMTLRQQRDSKSNNPYFTITGEGDDYPMYYVSWNDAQKFIQRMNNRNDGYFYRLPTEAEWEYACRAGTTGPYSGNLDSLGWYGNNSGRHYIDATKLQRISTDYDKALAENGNQAHPIGTRQPNRWNLYDMHGNVIEWCQDVWHESYVGAPPDGSAWLTGATPNASAVARGGSWAFNGVGASSAYRFAFGKDEYVGNLGFRLVAERRR